MVYNVATEACREIPQVLLRYKGVAQVSFEWLLFKNLKFHSLEPFLKSLTAFYIGLSSVLFLDTNQSRQSLLAVPSDIVACLLSYSGSLTLLPVAAFIQNN